MTQEEKAKAYDRVSKEVKDFFEGRQKMYSDVSKTLEYLFPELAESEDERTRKEIIDFLKLPHAQFVGKRDYKKWIAWLEKQGEQPKQDNSDVNDCNSIDPYFGKQIEMRPSWSEEDMSKVQRICKYLNEVKKYYADITEVRECIEWLKSIKDRIGFGLICTTK